MIASDINNMAAAKKWKLIDNHSELQNKEKKSNKSIQMDF